MSDTERLHFEGDLDKWMKIIGAGITGYQPEAYAVMDQACEELVKLRLERAVPSKRQIEAAIEAYEDGVYLSDDQVFASVTAIVKAALAVSEGSTDE